MSHVTRTPLSRSKSQRVNLQGAGAYCGGLPHRVRSRYWRESVVFCCLMLKRLATVRNGEFRPLYFRNPLTDFHETLNVELSPGDLSICKINFLSESWVVWRMFSLPQCFIFCLFWSHLAHRSRRGTHSHQTWSVGVFCSQDVPFGGLEYSVLTFNSYYPQNVKNGQFKPMRKHENRRISENANHREKFDTMLRT